MVGSKELQENSKRKKAMMNESKSIL